MVKRSGKLSGFLGKAESCVKSGFRCWSLKRMRCGVELALAQGSVTLGDQLWKQQRGVPIGGMVSKCSCSVTLGMSEQTWSETHGKQFKGHLAATRYVDDLVVLSPDMCSGCVKNLLKSVYPSGVEFEAQSGCEWLDMSLRIDPEGELVISAKQTESDWVYGRADKSGKHVLPPYLGDPSVDTRRMWCQVKGRAARLRQLKLRPAELYDAVKFDIATWRRAGWPYRHKNLVVLSVPVS